MRNVLKALLALALVAMLVIPALVILRKRLF